MGIQFRIIVLIGGLGLVLFVFNLVRKRKLRETYSLLWLLTGFVLLFLSIFQDLFWDRFSRLIGIDYPPSALFLIGMGFLFLIVLHYSVALSRLSEQNKELTQEFTILKDEFERLKTKIDGER
ncbi:DUF2304 domain-containing protein [bacterium]|nr:DUF2304 domain-containing protein [bacterium]